MRGERNGNIKGPAGDGFAVVCATCGRRVPAGQERCQCGGSTRTVKTEQQPVGGDRPGRDPRRVGPAPARRVEPQ